MICHECAAAADAKEANVPHNCMEENELGQPNGGCSCQHRPKGTIRWFMEAKNDAQLRADS